MRAFGVLPNKIIVNFYVHDLQNTQLASVNIQDFIYFSIELFELMQRHRKFLEVGMKLKGVKTRHTQKIGHFFECLIEIEITEFY